MILIIMAIMVFAAIMIVGYPLVSPERYRFEALSDGGDEPLEQLTGARNSVYDAIRDLEFDRATGKLSDTDYKAMRGRYDLRAADILQKMDRLAAKPPAGKTARAHKSGAGKTTCPQCRKPVEPGDRFCPVCGTRLA